MEDVNDGWNRGERSGLVSIGNHKLWASISGPSRLPSQPIIIIFPGSDAACDTWRPIMERISSSARVLLYDRSSIGRSEHGFERNTGLSNAKELSKLLSVIDVEGPYVLVAHSYGGCVAREFLQLHSKDIVGMVLSETGTETKCEHAEEQYETQILSDAPLAVIRGEAVINPSRMTSDETASGQAHGQDAYQKVVRGMQETDESLKREQLRLSRNSRFRNLPDCGHSVHIERPEVVVEEINWVLNNICHAQSASQVVMSSSTVKPSLVSRIFSRAFSELPGRMRGRK
ncbi:hypothetical protein ACLMJK_007650 [Lecanora helva]